jgi:hypothetical protein
LLAALIVAKRMADALSLSLIFFEDRRLMKELAPLPLDDDDGALVPDLNLSRSLHQHPVELISDSQTQLHLIRDYSC